MVFVLTNKASALSLPFLLPCPNTYIFVKDHLAVGVWTSAKTWSRDCFLLAPLPLLPLTCPTGSPTAPPRVQLAFVPDLVFPGSWALRTYPWTTYRIL